VVSQPTKGGSGARSTEDVIAEFAASGRAKVATDAGLGGERMSASTPRARARSDDVVVPVSGDASPNELARTVTRTGAAVTSDTPDRRMRSRRWAAIAVISAVVVAAGVAVVARTRPSTSAPSASAGAAASSPTKAACSTNDECVAKSGGKPALCVRADEPRCIAIESDGCKAFADARDIALDSTVWFGALLPMESGDGWTSAVNSLELGRRDFAQVGGVPGEAEGTKRRLALVVCEQPKDLRRAAEHLAELRVPAVINFGLHVPTTIDLISSVFLTKRILTLEVQSTSPLITRIPQPAGTPRLVWRPTYSADGLGAAIAHVVNDFVEPALRGPSASDRRPLKLAVLRSDNAFAVSVCNAAIEKLMLNGASLVEARSNFQQFVFARDALVGAAPEVRDSVIASINTFAPDIVVYAEGDLFVERVISKLERGWRGARRPTYVSGSTLDGSAILRFVGKDADKRRRFFGVDLPASTTENLAFVLHYNEAFQPALTPATAPGVNYDAFYLLAYAAATSRSATVTGADLAAGLARIGGDGGAVGIGPSKIFAALEVLRGDKPLHLIGAGSSLDFDTSGDVRSDFAIYCLDADASGTATGPIESGLRLNHATMRLEGRARCP
jgi:hypothetical protein